MVRTIAVVVSRILYLTFPVGFLVGLNKTQWDEIYSLLSWDEISHVPNGEKYEYLALTIQRQNIEMFQF